MTYAAVTIPDGVWGVDTSGKLTAALLDKLLSTDLHTLCPAAPPGTFVEVILRYVGLHGPARGDIDPDELALILNHPKRPILMLVQHVLAGSWTASLALGTQHGQAAAADAKAAGYDASQYGALSLICDMESLANEGAPVLAYVSGRLSVTAGDGFGPGVYKGFDDGVTGQQLLDLNCPLWAAPGQASLPGGATFAALQHGQVTIGGMDYDIDEFHIDSRGHAFVGLQYVDLADIISSDPHIDPSHDRPIALVFGIAVHELLLPAVNREPRRRGRPRRTAAT